MKNLAEAFRLFDDRKRVDDERRQGRATALKDPKNAKKEIANLATVQQRMRQANAQLEKEIRVMEQRGRALEQSGKKAEAASQARAIMAKRVEVADNERNIAAMAAKMRELTRALGN